KGQEYLLKAFAEVVQIFPETKLLLVGEGILRRKLQTLAAAHKIRDRVIFAGLVPPEEIPEYVAAMDIVAHTSLREGLPRAVAQGLAGGKPVVAFDVDGARELVKDGQTGYLVPARDNNTLIARLLHLLKNPQAAEAMGQAGRRLIEELFPVEKMVEKIEALYREALRRKRCSSSPHDVTYTYS
ncbi:MAG TPA: glycosyltransferase, partial [bacterium]|nr:glycosyltransferase [bacterium]